MIALIVAMRRYDRIIGIDGEIPWKIEGEQEQFKKLTKDNVVIMGRCTYEEIYKKLGRRSLPGRSKTASSPPIPWRRADIPTAGAPISRRIRSERATRYG